MARKPLLTESEIRNFMKLAELTPIGDDKISEMYGMPPGARDDEEDREEEDPAGESLEEKEMEMDMDMELGDDEPEMDMDPEPEMDVDPEPAMDMGADSKMVSVDDFMGALEDALEDVLGEPVSTEMDDDGDDMDMGDDEPEMDMGMDDDMGMGMDDDEPGMRDYMQEDLVNEVARRVAARLQEKNSQADMIDALAERIMNKLTK
tara:strand:- start:1386 stop:2000 length:615 start_codon:yes stop_codon:yes gene_type:complete